MSSGSMGAIAALLAAAALVAGCGEDTADPAALEEEIAADLTESAGVAPESVECPEDVALEEGETFECTVTAPNGDTFVFAGTLTDDQGSFEGEVPPEQFEDATGQSGAPEVADLESSLTTTIDDVRDDPETPLESVDCPDDALAEDPATFECELAGGSETGTVEVTVRGGEFEYSGTFAGSAFGGSPQEIEPAP